MKKVVMLKQNNAPRINYRAETTLVLKKQDGEQTIDLRNIIRIEADGSYSNFFLVDGTNILHTRNLHCFEKTIASNFILTIENMRNINTDQPLFFKTHKSFIINIQYLKFEKINKHSKPNTSDTIEMADGSIIPLSRRQKSLYKALLRAKQQKNDR